MSDDTAQTSMIDDPLEARVVVFRQQPEPKGFEGLRQELRAAGRGELLAELCAAYAQVERDPLRAADAWSEAGEAMAVLGETATAVEYLRTALELDPANERALDRLLELVEPGDPAAAVEILEAGLAELQRRGDDRRGPRGNRNDAAHRRAALHRHAAELSNDHLGRIDRALFHYQQAWKLEPQRTEALEAARHLYVSLGDDQMVAKLYQAELDVLGAQAAPAKRAELRHELGRIALRHHDYELAASHLEEAARLAPDALDIAETLAEIYATPGFRDGDDKAPWRGRASELFVTIGRHRLTTHDDATAISYLRRAVGVDPFSAPSSKVLEEALSETSQWDELDRILRHRTQVATDPKQRADVLRRRVALYRNQKPDKQGLLECLSELVNYEPPRGKAATELRELLRADQDWEPLSRLMENELNALGSDPETPADVLVGELLELATIAREHMGDRDRAAELLHQALGVMPTHEEALARYVDHFRERRDWRGLIDLLEFALDNAREFGAEPDDLVRRLEEIAQLAELRLGDIPRAIDAWQRIAEIENSPKVTEALRRLTARSKMWEQLVTSLESEVQTAGDPVTRMHSLKKMAQTYRERQIEPRRAIELYEQILAENPGDDPTLKALAELYEREGDDAGLAMTLRRILDTEAARLRGNRPPDAPIEWPVAKRSERLTMLRRLAILYETRLADVDGVVFACSAVLELLTGDRDALERMERVLDKANDPRLEQTLEYHAAASTSPAERSKLLKRLAKLAADRGDDAAALDRWERTLRASPSDPDALAALGTLYEGAERWVELAQVLERLDGGRPMPAPGTPDAAIRVFELERYAVVVDVHLRDPARGIKAWHRVLELSPKSRTALDALARLYRAAGKWRELAEILGAYISVLSASGRAEDREHACGVALERAEILEQRLGAPADAIKVLDHLIQNLDPNHLDAHTSLRRLHEARGDFDAAVRVAEREMYLAPEPARKVARGLEIGLICRDRLANPTRALQAFKRVLELDPEQDEAMAAAADLLYRLGRYKEHVQMIERMLGIQAAFEAPAEERRNLVQRIAQVTADKLGDPKAAFRWWRRAHEEAPDDNTLNDVRRAGEDYGLWRELADVLTDERKRLVAIGARGVPEPDRYVALSRELAQLAERRLGDKPRAMIVVAEALAVTPRDASLLGELERLASELDQRNAWKALADAVDVALAAAAPGERVDLYLRRAKLLDERVGDSKGAVADVLAAFSWASDERGEPRWAPSGSNPGTPPPQQHGVTRDDVREVLVRLAAKARAWNDVVAVDTALIERAMTTQRRVELLRRKAQVIEDQLKDAPRAFRSHLVALLLGPDDQDTASHAWRLARAVGKYREIDRTPKPEPPAATIQSDQAYADAQQAASRAAPGRPTQPRRVQTEPLADAELNLSVGDSTQPLDVDEIEIADKRAAMAAQPTEFATAEPTMALSPLDLARLTVPTQTVSPPRPPVPGATARGTSKLPPLPPRPPTIKPRTTPPSVPTTAPRKTQAVVRRPPIPTLPNRPFESPWEELALAYESLPAADGAARLRWLYRASEVWETGAKDIARAFDALARAFAVARRELKTPDGNGAHDAEVRARLHRIASEHRAWDRLAELYEGMAEQAETAPAAADLLMEVATIRGEQKRPREAEAQLRRILGMLPSDPTARSRLEELYRSEGRWVELAASLEERTDPRLGSVAPEAERPQLLRELAAIYTGKLSRGHDAIDAFERLRLLAPADTQVLFQLADLYGGVGRWSKVIETLARVDEVAEGSADSRDAQRSIAKIYETELELPERAIEAYEQIVATWPDDEVAWAALDRLYQQQAKWTELADVLRRRAALARDPIDRGHLLARRAGVLMDWLNAYEEAAAALHHARTVAPDDASLADQLIIALGRAGRHREAAATLEDRIDTVARASKDFTQRGELAALYIRLAQLRAEHLDDRSGAREAVDTALELVPEHPTALAVLAQLASPDEDPRAFADAKLREADSGTDDDARIAALMAAGDVLHTRVGDVDAARSAYERALALRPYHAEATWALAGLVEKGGDPETAARLLEGQLDDPGQTNDAKAKLLTQLAALSRAAGVEPAAERRLLEALSVEPAHVPAIVALSDFYADAERWDDLEAFLRDHLEGPLLAEAPPALIADLHRRLAHAHERLGRDDDAYQTLVAADRLHRGHLLIKLALGENRYKARRWREAALHLSPLAQHEDAPRYPSEVAQGLYHAALAEIRSLRPEKAPALYARALELKPSYAPALQALAEIAMEQGDHRRAADLLTRQATATEDPAERLRLFEALGDMALVMLGDDSRAVACYAAAVAAAQPIEARHLPLLTKLLERQQLAGDLAGGARTAELMAAFGATPAERAARHLQAARDYLAANEPSRARTAADRAVEADPYDVDACDLASALAIEAGDVEGAAAMLTRLLTARTTSPTDAARLALLSYRLGHARATRGDTRQALPMLDRAIQLAPDSDGATAARRVLVELSRDDAARRPGITEHLQAIAAATGELHDLVAWAEELCRADVADVGRAALDLVIACGQDLEVHQRAFLSVHEPYAMRDDESYPAVVDAADRDALVDPLVGELALLPPIAITLAEAATLLWPDLDAALARIGAPGARRVPASLHVPAVAMFPRLTTVLGLGPAMLYQDPGDAAAGVIAADAQVACAATPIVIIGPRLATGGTLAPAVRAHLARAVELARPEHMLFAGLPGEDGARLLASVARLFGPAALRDAVTARVVDQDIQRAHDEVVRAALPVRLRTRLEQLLATVPATALEPAAYAVHCHRTADRMALLVGGDPRAIVASVRARGDTTHHLVRALASPTFLAVRAKLGVGVR